MKIRKIVSGILAAVLCTGMMAGTVMADSSARADTVNAINNNSTNDDYLTRPMEEAPSYQKLAKEYPAVAQAIDEVNAAQGSSEKLIECFQKMSTDTSLPESVRKSAEKVLEQLRNKQGLTLFFDLDRTGEDVPKDSEGNYIPTLKIPALTSSITGIMVLHFNVQTMEWEILTQENGGITKIDPENQTITLKLSSLSPIIVLCNGGGTGSTNTSNHTSGTSVSPKSAAASGTTTSSGKTVTSSTAASSAKSPKTEDTSDGWMGFAAAAVVLAAGAAFVLRKKKA